MKKRSVLAACVMLGVAISVARADDETTHVDTASGLMGQKKFADAEAEYRQAIAIDPRYKQAWQGLGIALAAQGKIGAAQRAITVGTGLPDARSGPAPALTAEQQAALAEGDVAPPPAAPAAAQAPAVAEPPAPAMVPLAKSAIVKETKTGPVVADKKGKPVTGLKISIHDMDISCPNIGVAPDGTIHAVYVEQHKATYDYAVYHRASKDGGKTWSEPKNLSEPMPKIHVGLTRMVIDHAGRVFAAWRAGLKEDFQVSMDNGGTTPSSDLVYRILDQGKWSKIQFALPHGSVVKQDDGAQSWFLSVDPAGRVHAIFNTNRDYRHPETMSPGDANRMHIAAVGTGMIMDSILESAAAPVAQELLMSKVDEDPKGNGWTKWADGYDDIEGFVDGAGKLHMLAYVYHPQEEEHKTIVDLFEGGKEATVLTLPGEAFQLWHNPGKLLVDAKGRQHVIALYNAGEQPAVKDWVVGSDDEPTVIRAATVQGRIDGFQAWQLPGGKMGVLIQATDKGVFEDRDNYISTSDGTSWTPPVNITNNEGRASFVARNGTVAGDIAVSTRFNAGQGSIALDRSGHVLVLMINNECGSFSNSALGVEISGGSSSTPMLFFLKF